MNNREKMYKFMILYSLTMIIVFLTVGVLYREYSKAFGVR